MGIYALRSGLTSLNWKFGSSLFSFSTLFDRAAYASARTLRLNEITVATKYSVFILVTAIFVVSVRAQQPAEPTASKSRGITVAEVKPEMFYLKNKDGDLVYVPDFSFEQWEKLVRQARNLADPARPLFVMEEMTFDGDVGPLGAHLRILCRVTIRTSEDETRSNWIRIPLHLNGVFLERSPVFEGPGEHFVTFDELRDGYILWIQAKPGTNHQMTLDVLKPVEHVGEESRLTLHVPAPLASHLTLRIPDKEAEGTISAPGDSTGRPLAFKRRPDGHGEFTARGIRGETTVQWHKGSISGSAETTRLDIYGLVLVTADELLQEVHTDARFVVHSFSNPIERFRVRLPRGMRFRESPEPGYSVQVVKEDTDADPQVQVVEIRLKQPAPQEAHIRLIAELPPGPGTSPESLSISRLVDRPIRFQPARFEFIDAVRHRGRINFVVKGDWSLQWHDSPDIPRVEQGSDSTSYAGAVASFRYFAQPCDLEVSIHQQATRISVEPEYNVIVDVQQARLFAVLSCRTSGAKSGPLAVHIPGWTVEVVKFDHVDHTSPIDFSQVAPLLVPIPVAAQSVGRFTLRIEASCDLTAGVISSTQPLRISLPQIEAANPARANLIVSPATVTITPAQNVALTPRPHDTQALSPLVIPSSSPTEPTEAGSFRFRDRGAMEPAIFVADFRVQPGSISVSNASHITFANREIAIEQRFSFSVLHEPVSALALLVPRQVVDQDRVNLRLLLNDQALPSVVVGPADEDHFRVEAKLPTPLLGQAELKIVQPRRSMPKLSASTPNQITIPLVFPVADAASHTTIVDNNLTILYPRQIKLELVKGPWAIDETQSERGKMQLTTASDGGDAVLRLTLRPAALAGATIIRQVWHQTWLANSKRRDRSVFRVLTRESQLKIVLPHSSHQVATPIKIALDQRPLAQTAADPNGQVIVALEPSNGQAAHEHVVEIWYTFVEPPFRDGSLRLDVARLDGVDQAEQSYWELILPSSDVLIRSDSTMTEDQKWQWSGLGWRRHSTSNQKDLEDWIGATHQAPIPSTTNRYLFTTFGAPYQMEVTTLSQGVLVFVASGTLLVVGLLFVYFPIFRHPVTLLVLGIVVFALAWFRTELAVLAGQAALLGLALVLVAYLLRRTLERPVPDGRSSGGRQASHSSQMLDLQLSRAEGSSRIAPLSSASSGSKASSESRL